MDGLGGPVRRFIGLAMIIPAYLSLPHTHSHCRKTVTEMRKKSRMDGARKDWWRKGKGIRRSGEGKWKSKVGMNVEMGGKRELQIKGVVWFGKRKQVIWWEQTRKGSQELGETKLVVREEVGTSDERNWWILSRRGRRQKDRHAEGVARDECSYEKVK